MNYKAKLLRQEIAGLENGEMRRMEQIAGHEQVMERHQIVLWDIQKTLYDKRDELARIEAGETVG